MKELNFKRVLALLLTVLMVVGCAPAVTLSAFAASASDPVIVVACSDFQAPGGGSSDYTGKNTQGANNVKSILNRMKAAGYTDADGFICCGDYDHENNAKTSVVKNAITALKGAVESVFPGIAANVNGSSANAKNYEIFVEGNHDNITPGGETGVHTTGPHDTDDYGVFVVNEDDYEYYWNHSQQTGYGNTGDGATKVKAVAASMKSYFNAKIAEGYTKPIFIASHLPLHFSSRTMAHSDNMNALYLFNEIEAAAEAGLTIIYICGHNHSQGYDDYLGGASYYFAPGDHIEIADPAGQYNKHSTKTIQFTYMNAGYVGYYDDKVSGNENDVTLTMSVFKITDSTVTIERYDASGVHNLKSKGFDTAYNGKSMGSAYVRTEVTQGPAVVQLAAGDPVDPDDPTSEDVPSDVPSDIPDDPTPVAQEFTDAATGIKVYGYGESLTVSETPAGASYQGIEKYKQYAVQLNGYLADTETTVTIPVPAGYAGQYVRVFKLVNGTLVNMAAEVKDGKAVFTETSGQGTYLIAQNVIPQVDNWVEIPGKTEYIYTLDTDGVNAGEKYLIVGESYAKALKTDLTGYDVTISGNTITLDTDAYGWTLNGSGKTIVNAGGKYLQYASRTLNGNSTTSTNWTIAASDQKNGKYNITNGSYYLRWSNSNGKFQASSSYRNPVRLFRQTSAVVQTAGFVGMSAEDFIFPAGSFATTAELNAYLRSQITVSAADTIYGDGLRTVTDYTLTGSADPTVGGVTGYTVSYGGVTVGSFTVTVTAKELLGVSVKNGVTEITVNAGIAVTAPTGASLVLSYSDGSSEEVALTLSMLQGSFDRTEAGRYPGLSAGYEGFTVTGLVLNVLAAPGSDTDGSVRVNKHADGVNFAQNGVGRVELSASGIPVSRKGADIIVMLDTSSSMSSNTMSSGKTRLQGLKEALTEMLAAFGTPDENGNLPDIRIAIGDFNGYTELPGIDYDGGSNPDMIEGVNTNQTNKAKIFTGSGSVSAAAFVKADTIDAAALVGKLTTTSGTNYDYAFDTAYRLGASIQAANEEQGIERDLYVVFMSDGSPYQYNYFYSRRQSVLWNDWLKGTMTISASGDITVNGTVFDQNSGTKTYRSGSTTAIKGYSSNTATNLTTYNEKNTLSASSHLAYYNGAGNKHRMAEAIKGDVGGSYLVIDPTNSLGSETSQQYMRNVPGLGATIYTIGFCLGRDQNTAAETVEQVLTGLASQDENGEPLYFAADTEGELTAALSVIAGSVSAAVSDAYFVDTLGGAYDLQTASFVTDSQGNVISLGGSLQFTVSAYDLYRYADLGGAVTLDMVGTRKEQSRRLIETVSFSADGSRATSDKRPGVQNIIEGSLLRAANFVYNLSKTESVTLENGFVLAPETFCWQIGSIGEQEYVLSYYVCLTDAMEGVRDPGSYATNESAILYYTSSDGVKHELGVSSPQFSWKSASVSYGFYLVNAAGQIIDGNGSATGFAGRQQVGEVTLYKEAKMNESGVTLRVDGLTVLPDGYRLYDTGAAFTVYAASSPSNSYWTITNTAAVSSTYVTRYLGGGFTNEEKVTAGSKPGYSAHSDYSFTDTVVWFAVVYEPHAEDDTVVIDFGLPVEISVLANDLPLAGAAIAGLSLTAAKSTEAKGDTALDARWNGKTLSLSHGSVTIRGGKLVYTPSDLQMSAPESFSYAMRYQVKEDGETVSRYFYANVTVAPATVIYYETDFSASAFTFRGSYETVGASDDRVQAEDRPGPAGAFGNADGDNLYGYDPAYAKMELYSGGSAVQMIGTTLEKVNGENVYGTGVSFTFTGTGFDIIGLTGAEQGAVRAVVRDQSGEQVKAITVIITDARTLREVPILNCLGLPYGKYTVDLGIHVPVASLGIGGEVTLDAVRIYDPAKGSAAEAFHLADGEADPTFLEVRNQLIDEGMALNDLPGAAFLAEFSEEGSTVTRIATYTNMPGHGPNNEVYLSKGQAIAFTLDTTGLAGIHVGAKLIGFDAAQDTEAFTAGDLSIRVCTPRGVYETVTEKITSATALNFDLLNGIGLRDGETVTVVVIGNRGDGVVSLTNLKLIGTAETVGATAPVYVNEQTVTFAAAALAELPGDADFDGVISVRDVTALLAMLMDDAIDNNRISRVYDANRDGTVSIADVTAIFSLMNG